MSDSPPEQETPTPQPPKTLAYVWRAYVRMILDPIKADRIQRIETKRAFYAGASAAVTILVTNLSPDREPTAEDFALMDSVVAELDNFGTEVRSGRA